MGHIEMRGDFDAWLREQAACSNCEHYFGDKACGHPQAQEHAKTMQDMTGFPVASFTVDPNASARWCETWDAKFEWRRSMRRGYDMAIEEEQSAYLHHAAVQRIKGYQHA